MLDVNIIIDVLAHRDKFAERSAMALAKCRTENIKTWVYAGYIKTLEYSLTSELKRKGGIETNFSSFNKIAKKLIQDFIKDCNWLAALSEEMDVFEGSDPEDEQLIRALDRFEAGSCKLLTRDDVLLNAYPEKTISPGIFIRTSYDVPTTPFIDLQTQQDMIRPYLEKRIHSVLHHGQYIMGPEIQELEEKLAGYTGAKYCITVSSGTEALLISLMALGIQPGDEVITTPFTFVATAEVIVILGAKPVFVDIDPSTCNIDSNLIEAKITSKTKAIIPVSLYGQPSDMDRINEIAQRNGNIPVIEDAAQSFGATYKGKKSCNLSTIGCTSFFPSKPLGCYGDGGAIFTSDESIAQACREIRVHGQSKRYYHSRIGVGGRMDTLQAAIVLAKLEKFDWEVKRRFQVGGRYNQLLDERDIPRVRQIPEAISVYGQYTVLVQNRDAVQKELQAIQIPTAVHYPIPLNKQPAYNHFCCDDCTPISDEMSGQVMSLPMSPYLSEKDQNRIIDGFVKTVKL